MGRGVLFLNLPPFYFTWNIQKCIETFNTQRWGSHLTRQKLQNFTLVKWPKQWNKERKKNKKVKVIFETQCLGPQQWQVQTLTERMKERQERKSDPPPFWQKSWKFSIFFNISLSLQTICSCPKKKRKQKWFLKPYVLFFKRKQCEFWAPQVLL